jgi:hypothetical protein
VTGRRKKFYTLAIVWAATLFLIWPILRHRAILAHWEWRTRLATILSYILAVFLAYLFYRAERRRGLDRSRSMILAVLIFSLTGIVNQIHYFFVDKGAVFSYENNLAWQEGVHAAVVRFDFAAIPHIYRFLPNGVVLWMQLLRIDFHAARDIYRLIFNLLLFYALYRYARLYTDYLGGILTLLFVAVVYPIGFEAYAGQLTDPMSHLSFVLAFIFLETGDFAFLLSTLLIGSLAKETVLALAGFYVLFCRTERRYPFKALILCLCSAVAYWGVRLLVLRGPLHYQQVSSGISLAHPLFNLRTQGWLTAILALFGGYTVFLVLAWNDTPSILKRLVLYLLPILIGANMLIGWLHEIRNYMPAVFVLAVIAARYISRHILSPRIDADRPEMML